MGWRAIYKDGTERVEGVDGRPVQDGEEGKLLVITQEDFGHKVAVDLLKGVISVDYQEVRRDRNVDLEIVDPRMVFWICDETNIVGDLAHLNSVLVDLRDEDNRKVLQDGKFVKVRNDILTSLTWRPIWFTRMTNGEPTKVIGAQTTMPKEQAGKNAKRMVVLFSDGRLGID
jgi:hypothetical protein